MSNRPSKFATQRLLQILAALPRVNAYVVGFSGGADSTALLHALSVIRPQLDAPLSAVHINHGLHGDAALWQSHCERFCERYQVPLISLDINPDNSTGKGLEAAARHLRYAAIEGQVADGAGLLTAHHADDQAETLLLNLMRGSGVDGLAAMPDSRPFGKGLLQRPLLEFQGSALRDYLRTHNVEWVEDPSNQHTGHDRNFVRHEVIPLLETHWPEVSKRLLLTRRAMSGARYLLEGLADEYLAQHLAHPQVLQITPQARTGPELFKLIVRRWLKTTSMPSMPVYRLESLLTQVCQAKAGHKVSVEWGDCVLHCYRQQLWLLPNGELPACQVRGWPVNDNCADLGDDIGQLALTPRLPDSWAKGLTISNRTQFSDAAIEHGGHHKSLKKIFQASGIPTWLRDCVPLSSLNGELVAIGDWFFSDRFTELMSTHQTRLKWRPRNALLQYLLARQHTDG